MTEPTVTIGTRGSALALAQTELVAAALRHVHPTVQLAVRTIRTAGDRDQASPLERIGGQGVFVKDIEAALREGKVDLAVHSLKDMPTESPAGLRLAAILPREDPRDALVSRHGQTLDTLPSGARVGSSSVRRRAQLLAARPDLRIVALRGNVDTRLRKAQGSDYDAIVLAVAGLVRLGRTAEITEILSAEVMLPAVGQGAIAIQAREDDSSVLRLLVVLDDADTRAAVLAERTLLRAFAAGCQVPIAAHAVSVPDERLWLRALVCSADGARVVRGELTGFRHDPEGLGRQLSAHLMARGAGALLREV